MSLTDVYQTPMKIDQNKFGGTQQFQNVVGWESGTMESEIIQTNVERKSKTNLYSKS